MKKICQCCQIEFIANGEYSKRHRKYCSLECYKKSISTTIEIACQMCGESFAVRGKYKNRKFCSTSCYRQNKKNSSKTILMKCVNCDNYISRYKYHQVLLNIEIFIAYLLAVNEQRDKFMTYFTPMNLEWREKDAN